MTAEGREDVDRTMQPPDSALDHVTDGVVAVDSASLVTYVNAPAAALLGRDRSALVGRPIEEVLPRGAETGFETYVDEALRTGERTTFEGFAPELSTWVDGRVHPAEDGVVVYLRAASTREQAESEPKTRRLKQINALINNTEHAVYIKDTEGNYELVNEAAADLFGMTPEEVVGKHDSDLFDADSVRAIREVDERILEERVPDRREAVRYIDGVEHVFLDDKFPFEEEKGTVAGILGISRDVTAARNRSRELERQQYLFDAIQDLASIGVWEFDLETETLTWSDGVYEIHGLDTTYEPTVAEALDFYHPDDRAAITAAVDRAVDEGAPYELDARIIRADGEVRDVRTHGEHISGDGERGDILRGTIQDITTAKEYERELERRNTHLDEFASVIAHDIRNPLSVALGRVQTLDEEVESGHIPPVLRALTRIQAIVADTLTLARQGTTVAETAAIPISSLVGQCWGTVDTEGATLESTEAFTIVGDRNRLRHVFENLFSNAVQHGGAGVTVRVGRLGNHGFYVEDDGPGIHESERETVFEPGHRSATGGTGFGLTIVSRIAEAHGWEVNVTDSDTGGARFEFTGVDIV